MNKKLKIGLISIFVILALGFILGIVLKGSMACTEMGCPCSENSERPCNSCTSRDPIFVLGIINVFKECEAREIILCETSDYIGTRYDTDYSSCKFLIGY